MAKNGSRHLNPFYLKLDSGLKKFLLSSWVTRLLTPAVLFTHHVTLQTVLKAQSSLL